MGKMVYADTQSKYDSLETKDENKVYFVADTQRIYRGSELIATNNIIIVETEPTLETCREGTIYIYKITDSSNISGYDMYININNELIRLGGNYTFNYYNVYFNAIINDIKTLKTKDTELASDIETNTQNISELTEYYNALYSALTSLPSILSGTTTPASTLGKAGDIYVQYD